MFKKLIEAFKSLERVAELLEIEAKYKATQEKEFRRVAAIAAKKRPNVDGWIVHSPYHWARYVHGLKLDYWPTKHKFAYKGKIMQGDVNKFIKKLEQQKH